MNVTTQARSGYAAHAAPIRTERGSEYAIFAQVTHRLKDVDATDKSAFPRVADAVVDNQRLWSTLAEDLMLETNALPINLRAQLISLAEFSRKHGMKVLAGQASLQPLIDINTAIMRGLRGDAEASA